MRKVALVVLALGLSACVEPAGGGDAYRFSGSFTEEATQQEMSEFTQKMKQRGANDVLLMESFPVQFQVVGLGNDCEDVRLDSQTLSYVESASPCTLDD